MSRILLVAAELAEVAAVGGVAEYVLGLASGLVRAGHDVRVALPAYACLDAWEGKTLTERLVVPLGVGATSVTPVRLHQVSIPGDGRTLAVVTLGRHAHLRSVRNAQRHIYDWPNHEPWIAFCRAVVEWVAASDDWMPDVIHCQDAQTALVPVYVQQRRVAQPNSAWSRLRTVLTVHNLLNQGIGSRELIAYAALPAELYSLEGFEFYGSVNCIKAGLLAADRVNTVSRTYAREISTSGEMGFGLEGVLYRLLGEGKLSGIVNGIDEGRWSLPGVVYDGSDADVDRVAEIKRAHKTSLMQRWGWDASDDRPLIAFRGRWDRQKGVLLLVEMLEEILEYANLAIVTWGGPGEQPALARAWHRLHELAETHPERLVVNAEGIVDLEQTREHYAAADHVLMPSVYEPCGLIQMECQRCGAVPIVRKTGGLADTVAEDVSLSLPSPNGFVFDRLVPDEMLAAVRRATFAYHDPTRRRALLRNTLIQRNGWSNRIGEYLALYTS